MVKEEPVNQQGLWDSSFRDHDMLKKIRVPNSFNRGTFFKNFDLLMEKMKSQRNASVIGIGSLGTVDACINFHLSCKSI